MTHIILHSDDLGITARATEQVLDSWRSGALDSFSIIANGDATRKIPGALMATPELRARIAVHFNLTEGRSSAAAEQVPLLVDRSGQLRHTFGSLLQNIIFSLPSRRRELLRQINKECAAQIVEVRSLCPGREITAVDGHNHIHMIPGVFAEVARAAYAADIPFIRISDEPFFMENPRHDGLRLFWWINLIKLLLLGFFSVNARQVARKVGLHAPDAMIGVLYSGNMSAKRALRGIRAASGATEIEVIFHIGRATSEEASRWRDATYAEFHLSKSRDDEREEISRLATYLRNKDISSSGNQDKVNA